MTLDEAIKHAEEVAKEQEKDEQFYTMSRPDKERRNSCRKCVEEYKQLAEWLKDYKQLLEQDAVPFDFELYQAGLMDMPKEMIKVLDHIRSELEQLPTKTRTNWDGCCPDIDYPEIEYVDVTKNKLLSIIDKYKTGSEEKE